MQIEHPKKEKKPRPQIHKVQIWIPVERVSQKGVKYIDKKPAYIDKAVYEKMLEDQKNPPKPESK